MFIKFASKALVETKYLKQDFFSKFYVGEAAPMRLVARVHLGRDCAGVDGGGAMLDAIVRVRPCHAAFCSKLLSSQFVYKMVGRHGTHVEECQTVTIDIFKSNRFKDFYYHFLNPFWHLFLMFMYFYYDQFVI